MRPTIIGTGATPRDRLPRVWGRQELGPETGAVSFLAASLSHRRWGQPIRFRYSECDSGGDVITA